MPVPVFGARSSDTHAIAAWAFQQGFTDLAFSLVGHKPSRCGGFQNACLCPECLRRAGKPEPKSVCACPSPWVDTHGYCSKCGRERLQAA